MKKLWIFALTLALAATAACGKPADTGTTTTAGSAATEAATTTAKTEKTVLRVGASVTPHAEILAQVKDTLAEQGIELEIVEFADYVLPNTALEEGELDANYFQHKPYLEKFNVDHGTHLVAVGDIHYEPMGLYAGKTATLDALPDGAVISVPNDGTNEARALLLLEAQGIIKLKEGAGLNATKIDIVENPKNVKIEELEAAQLGLSLQDVDLAVINANYAIQAGLTPSTDALARESADSEALTYANAIVVKEGSEQNSAVLALIDALRSDAVKKFITDQYAGAVIPVE